MTWQVRATNAFWSTVRPFKEKYPHREYLAIVNTIREAIAELYETGHVVESGWNEHVLRKYPFGDGTHFEFHIHDDDVLVVYCKRDHNRTIRMIGVFDHESIATVGR